MGRIDATTDLSPRHRCQARRTGFARRRVRSSPRDVRRAVRAPAANDRDLELARSSVLKQRSRHRPRTRLLAVRGNHYRDPHGRTHSVSALQGHLLPRLLAGEAATHARGALDQSARRGAPAQPTVSGMRSSVMARARRSDQKEARDAKAARGKRSRARTAHRVHQQSTPCLAATARPARSAAIDVTPAAIACMSPAPSH